MSRWEWFLSLTEQTDAYGNSLGHWLAALAAGLTLIVGLGLLKQLLVWRVGAAAPRRPAGWPDGVLDLLRRTHLWFLLVVGLYGGTLLLVLPKRLGGLVTAAAIIGVLTQTALWADGLLCFWIARQTRRQAETNGGSAATLTALGFFGRLAIWTLVILLAMANLGIDITAMIAGLGIGGVAVALAAQNILGDLFASASIVLDKPFVLGDVIDVDGKMGAVEHIGMKTTRLRAISGEQLVFSNNDLLKSRIHNYKRMNERRAVLTLGVPYRTPIEKLERLPAILREAVESQALARFDRAHFKTYGDSALQFELVYFVLSPDYHLYMDVQQAVNLAIFRRFAAEDIEFAAAVQTVVPSAPVKSAVT